jgi:hypothetical protein
MKRSLKEWKLLERIRVAEADIVDLVERCDGKLIFEIQRFGNDLKKYVQEIQTTVQRLFES